jgi:GT2 family glycosyltransferase
MPLNVLVVSYRRADVLRRCLESVRRWLPGTNVLVWDNRSDGTASVRDVAVQWAEHEWVFSPRNVGFASAVNQLAGRTAEGDLLLLNPDAELLGPLTATRALLESAPDVAATGPLYQDGGTISWDNARRPPNLARMLVNYAGYAEGLRGWPWSDRYSCPPQGPVGYLAGACLLICRRAWHSVGAFDDGFFLYTEELDWCMRARRTGWRVLLAPEIGVRHLAGGTVNDSPEARRRSAQLLLESQVRYLTIRGPAVAACTFRHSARLLDAVQRSKRNG